MAFLTPAREKRGLNGRVQLISSPERLYALMFEVGVSFIHQNSSRFASTSLQILIAVIIVTHFDGPMASLLAAYFLVKRGTLASVRATPADFSKQWNSTWQLLAR